MREKNFIQMQSYETTDRQAKNLSNFSPNFTILKSRDDFKERNLVDAPTIQTIFLLVMDQVIDSQSISEYGGMTRKDIELFIKTTLVKDFNIPLEQAEESAKWMTKRFLHEQYIVKYKSFTNGKYIDVEREISYFSQMLNEETNGNSKSVVYNLSEIGHRIYFNIDNVFDKISAEINALRVQRSIDRGLFDDAQNGINKFKKQSKNLIIQFHNSFQSLSFNIKSIDFNKDFKPKIDEARALIEALKSDTKNLEKSLDKSLECADSKTRPKIYSMQFSIDEAKNYHKKLSSVLSDVESRFYNAHTDNITAISDLGNVNMITDIFEPFLHMDIKSITPEHDVNLSQLIFPIKNVTIFDPISIFQTIDESLDLDKRDVESIDREEEYDAIDLSELENFSEDLMSNSLEWIHDLLDKENEVSYDSILKYGDENSIGFKDTICRVYMMQTILLEDEYSDTMSFENKGKISHKYMTGDNLTIRKKVA